ncbi:nucleoid-associated protein [Pseudomonas yamanorum]|uniref:nucleoid-associated protein n=1 Tax=Pseudomonas yamanorum TaxID=515393 RepID=UPI0015A2006E|nr:nucleoid-associated protein [Pseudomonas yamanorum]NVZ84728.1 nucleoid-associated protein [Pseudomonas yamanorum]
MSDIFNTLEFSRIVLHNVHKPEKKNEQTPPTLSSDLAILNSAGIKLLQDRVSRALAVGAGSLAMGVKDKAPSSCYQYAKKLLDADDRDFITLSAAIAIHHTAIHTSQRWPGGTLVIISGFVDADRKRCIVIIKAEQQTGFMERFEAGKITLDFLQNLILTPQTKLYKIGVFYEVTLDGTDNTELHAHVFDSNIKSNDERQAAKYFYDAFLGLMIPENAVHRTKEFYVYTSEFIENTAQTPERKFDLQNALYSYLKLEQSATIETAEFGKRYLSDTEADDFSNYMTRKGFPDSAILKDLKLITSKLRLRKLNFTGGIKIIAPADKSDKIKITGHSTDETYITIGGILESQDK